MSPKKGIKNRSLEQIEEDLFRIVGAFEEAAESKKSRERYDLTKKNGRKLKSISKKIRILLMVYDEARREGEGKESFVEKEIREIHHFIYSDNELSTFVLYIMGEKDEIWKERIEAFLLEAS